ncbi:MAG: GNAT family N-acetyltransferase [Oscillospiraceae bacterium]|nr:GNAT family N-acetyltransferase [Oscillospiraceae bacterium]
MIHYKILKEGEIDQALFRWFFRRQVVNACWRRENGQWLIKDDPFIDDWSEADYQFLVQCLKHTASAGGFVCGGFCDGRLKGFVSVEPGIFGGEHRYLDLSSIHVSADMRGNGIGKALFSAAKAWAREQGAKKLYISAHSAVESQVFYKAMGCVEAKLYQMAHVEKEPFDCQLECELPEIVLRNIKKEEFDRLLPLFPGDEACWQKFRQVRLAQFDAKEVDIYVLETAEGFVGEISVNYVSHELSSETIPNRRVYLETFRLAENYQGVGFGQKLLHFALAELEGRGFTEFTIGVEEDNDVAKHIYGKLGFTEPIDQGHGSEFDPCEYTLYLRKI